MKKFFLLILASSLSLSLFAHEGHESLQTNAKIAEIAAHRIGRLVDTRKIEDSFVKNITSIAVTNLSHSAKPTDPAFNVLVSQPSNEEGKSKEVLMSFDSAGKFISNKILSTQGSRTISWPGLDPLELIEISLHFVTEATNTSVDITPFNKNLKKLILNQKVSEDGSVLAVIILSASNLDKQLEITLSAGGDLLNYAVIE